MKEADSDGNEFNISNQSKEIEIDYVRFENGLWAECVRLSVHDA